MPSDDAFGFPVSEKSAKPQALILPDGAAAAKDEPDKPLGLECRRCACRHFDVVYTRPVSRGRIRRLRQCRYCGLRVTTTEKVES